jgi:hypothetical protein
MKSEILRAVKMSMLVFWVSTPFGTEYGGSMFLINVGIYLQVHTVLQLRSPKWIIVDMV